MNIELRFADGLMSFVNSFNITVDAISRLLPDQQHLAETILYDLRSFAESMDSKAQVFHYWRGKCIIIRWQSIRE